MWYLIEIKILHTYFYFNYSEHTRLQSSINYPTIDFSS